MPRLDEISQDLKRRYMTMLDDLKKQNRRFRKCFWTRPFGHIWTMSDKGYRYYDFYVCVCCGKKANHAEFRRSGHDVSGYRTSRRRDYKSKLALLKKMERGVEILHPELIEHMIPQEMDT